MNQAPMSGLSRDRWYRAVASALHEGLLLVDADDVIFDANCSMERLSGYRASELIGKPAAELFPGEDYVRRLPSRIADRQAGRTEQYRVTLTRKEGDQRWVEVRASPVLDAVGELQAMVATLVDLTVKRQADHALQASEARLRTLFDESLTGELVATPEGEIQDCNPAFVEMFGFPSIEAAKATPIPELFADSEARAVLFRKLVHEGRVDRFTINAQRIDGAPVNLVARMVASFDNDGRLTQIRTHLLDDTERQRTEEQLREAQKMEAVGQLAGGIAHDFNNLLTAINGYTELAIGQLEENSPAVADLEQVKHSAHRAAELTRQLLAFSRRQTLLPRILDVNQVVQEMLALLRRLISENIEVSTRLAPSLPPVKADPGQLQQVLVNLVVNARDEMPDGGLLVLETSRVAEGGNQGAEGSFVRLTVRDTGGGIDPDIVDRIFDPFFTTKPVGQGTGLGLSVVYGIVHQSGGRLQVESRPGVGASFHVDLPAAEEPARERETEEVAQPAVSGPK